MNTPEPSAQEESSGSSIYRRFFFIVVLCLACTVVAAVFATQQWNMFKPRSRPTSVQATTAWFSPSPSFSGDNSTPSATGSKHLSIVTLGDSVPAGMACDCDTYSQQVAQALSRRHNRTAGLVNLALGGARSSDIVAQLATPQPRADITTADLVLLQVGANDFNPEQIEECANNLDRCYGADLTRLRRNISSLTDEISRISNYRAKIAVIGYWNVFPDGKVGSHYGEGYLRASDRLTRKVNTALRKAAGKNGQFIDAYTPIKGKNGKKDPTSKLAPDGDHLDASGHTALAKAILAALGPSFAAG
ncbi:SGNH/GDSL hydrolase family protein [Dermatophilus congolensis]|uniref:SGNH/GDSL hydrolase family protein n=1 Tax=Dermatophilus congolensis TaxID=1863 RepID=UPI001AAE2FF3|nr:SGNH/GDSL hydrolase family protein [Dermatophilus congolensis]MBO3129802.1 SGNH/GDSL hydrolase family protein [Dermatophilus congolensis]MBO3131569.1 SGNH/GDSL hydrolase family protein [Dermatophilus congolensis]MBO3134278.1 SGNH/GDSL hydrolase family protein [Dermatophilus congolensis]MBO3136511.1 SGNH/GDSL hydrolase family protein [Dermatophilus congolensis]MBO3138756.1 SGNH/GDSL hydrolase family protein [Dermatophilus congolensis]